jgi:hypothetical protein
VRPPRQVLPAVPAVLLVACGSHATATTTRDAEAADVRAFMQSVAADVSRTGPAAWADKFESGPPFFMASDGQLVFADGAAAQRGVGALARTLPKITLRFGDDLRVDVLTPQLAVVGASYFESQTDAAGHEHEVTGYVTALARLHAGRWRLRHAHWSSLAAAQP